MFDDVLVSRDGIVFEGMTHVAVGSHECDTGGRASLSRSDSQKRNQVENDQEVGVAVHLVSLERIHLPGDTHTLHHHLMATFGPLKLELAQTGTENQDVELPEIPLNFPNKRNPGVVILQIKLKPFNL